MSASSALPSSTDADSDVLGLPYTSETLHLRDDSEGEVVATLVKRPTHGETNCAVLHVHGFADYFFHTEYAEWWTERGYTFYALDLRKFGRSIRAHQTANYVADLSDYYEELDAALALISQRDGHDVVVLSAHSTGGLVVPLWMNDRRPECISAIVLNAPWLDLRGPWLMRSVGTEVIRRVAARSPERVLPRPISGFYVRSLHRDHDGEWEFDLDWKPLKSRPVRAGWFNAVREGHARVQRGLDLEQPILVMASDRTTLPTEMGEDVHTTDIVLDVDQIRRHSPALGRHVTIATIEGAVHDVILSRPKAREKAYDELDRWLKAYVEA